MKDLVRPAVLLTLIFTALCGLLYPALVTVLAAPMPHPAPQTLIGQTFSDPGHFWGRLSAIGYDARTSSGANLGPTNPALLDNVKARITALHDADPGNDAPIPVDLVTASSSGLDPDISPAAARYQARRVARVRGLPEATVTALIDRHIQERTLGILGEPRVNVRALNLALDALGATPR